MIDTTRKKFKKYIYSSINKSNEFVFTLNSQTSEFALIFGIYSLNLIKEKDFLNQNSLDWSNKILLNLSVYKEKRKKINKNLIFDKPYLQLLTFSLSALRILNFNDKELINNIIEDVLPTNIELLLKKTDALNGKAGSGNFAMFYAILILNSNLENKSELILEWANSHYNSMNKNGFWGNHLNHLSFQNGYHQYEIFKYINYKIDKKVKINALNHILNCSDNKGHFAPYPGGGACFDYDAVFMIDYLSFSKKNDKLNNKLFMLRKTLLEEQNLDGGFCENKYVRPFKVYDFCYGITRSKNFSIFIERLKHFIYLLRPKNSLITNHWCNYSRKWNESNLWDSWFRLQTIAIIEIYFEPKLSKDWGFIDFPGIGFRKN
jgi:hypothetical protein